METKKYKNFQNRVQTEFNRDILPFWHQKAIDKEKGGFFGRMTNDLQIPANSPKGIILNSRILWTFSAIYRFNRDPKNLQFAERAYNYLIQYFFDPLYGGTYWMLDCNGQPIDNKKKVYAQAFTLYALTEYYLATQSLPALEKAKSVFNLIETKCADSQNGGYFETFNRDWSIAEDVRLSDKDMNEKKSMNSHLHVLEAYTNLYRTWHDKAVAQKITALLEIFTKNIINSTTHQFRLFFDEGWRPKSDIISFGHDIEGSWLLYEAAEALQNKKRINEISRIAVAMAQKAYDSGLDSDGGLYYEGRGKKIIDADKHWWPQAEAAVGFLNAFSISKKNHFYDASYHSWQFIEQYIVDKKNGEWFWKVDRRGKPDENQFKISEWKCPYHNSRACMELMNRLTKLITMRGR